MSTTDRVSPELREAEKEIDNYYKSNPLLELPFATAAWYLLAFGENWFLKQAGYNLTSQESEMMIDNLVNELKHPISWIFSTCEPGGQIPSAYDDGMFDASWNLFRLGRRYGWFDTAYRYGSNGWVRLKLQESTIQPTKELFTSQEYKAYNYLIKTHETDEVISSIDFDSFHLLGETVSRSVKVKGNRFSYEFNPRIIDDAIKVISPCYDNAFSLPGEWEFSRYSLIDFRRVFEAISAMASIHWRARMTAIEMGCQNMAYLDSIFVPTCNELANRVIRYSRVSEEKVLSIFDDLTYGNREVFHPDPALQPLIKLNSESYAIMPHLWLSSNPERNLTALFNKIKSEEKIYRKLVSEKEDLMRQCFTTDLYDKGFRFVWGNVANLPDVDLAIVNDSEKACLLLELKWFIDPAEIREIIDRSKDIKKGICQVLKFKDTFVNNHEPLLKKLKIDSSYRFEGVVVSQNWIGHAHIQSPEVPVIRANHLIEKLKATGTLRSTIEWLKDRKYLPKEGKDFNVQGITSTIGKWDLKWSGAIEPLIEGGFFPL